MAKRSVKSVKSVKPKKRNPADATVSVMARRNRGQDAKIAALRQAVVRLKARVRTLSDDLAHVIDVQNSILEEISAARQRPRRGVEWSADFTAPRAHPPKARA